MTTTEPCRPNPLFIELSFDNIYSFALATLKLKAEKPFTLNLLGQAEMAGLDQGVIHSSTSLGSIQDKGLEVIAISALGMMQEVPLACAKGATGVESYGMQFFPFLSSAIQFQFDITGAQIQTLQLSLPDKFRIIWFKQQVLLAGHKLQMAHSQGENDSIYIFTRPTENAEEQTLTGHIPVRLGGKEFLRIVTLPTFYFSITLIALALLGLQNKPNVTFGAVSAACLLMLRQLMSANAPQLNTCLRDLYFLFGMLMLLWATCWELWEVQASPISVIILGVLGYMARVNRHFLRTGVLPRRMEKLLYYFRSNNEKKNRSEASQEERSLKAVTTARVVPNQLKPERPRNKPKLPRGRRRKRQKRC